MELPAVVVLMGGIRLQFELLISPIGERAAEVRVASDEWHTRGLQLLCLHLVHVFDVDRHEGRAAAVASVGDLARHGCACGKPALVVGLHRVGHLAFEFAETLPLGQALEAAGWVVGQRTLFLCHFA